MVCIVGGSAPVALPPDHRGGVAAHAAVRLGALQVLGGAGVLGAVRLPAVRPGLGRGDLGVRNEVARLVEEILDRPPLST